MDVILQRDRPGSVTKLEEPASWVESRAASGIGAVRVSTATIEALCLGVLRVRPRPSSWVSPVEETMCSEAHPPPEALPLLLPWM
jgi:hypothetical protein